MIERMRFAVARVLWKAAGLSFVPRWLSAAWSDISFRSLVTNGYKGSAAVWGCVRVWATTFPEPELGVRRKTDTGSEWETEHPARLLVARPNPFMGEDSFWSYAITYLAIGGNCYVWKERSPAGRVVALWPLHDGQMEPVPGTGGTWLSHYLFDPGDGIKVPVSVADVIQLIWAVDPLQPTRGVGPLVAAARAVDMGNEAARYVYAMLKNDATTRTLVTLKEPIGDERIKQMKRQWVAGYGGDERGAPAVIEGSEATVTRLGANLQELAVEALWNMPETWICAAFEVPAVKVGLNVGLTRGAGAIAGSSADVLNTEFAVSRLMPRWRNVAAQFTAGLLPEFEVAPGLTMEFDTSVVQALREDENDLRANLNASVGGGGWLTVNEARVRAGYPAVPGGDVFLRSIASTEVAMDERRMLPAPGEAQPSVSLSVAEKAISTNEAHRRSVKRRKDLADLMRVEVEKALSDLQDDVVGAVAGNGHTP